MQKEKKVVPIWFFIGMLLLAYGVIILASGLYSLVSPPEHTVVLAHLHADIWWGLLLLLMGAFYCIKFRPAKA